MATVALIEIAFSPNGSAVRNATHERTAIPRTEPIAIRVGACVFSITYSVNNAPFATANSEMVIMSRVPIQISDSLLMKPHIDELRNNTLSGPQTVALIYCDRSYIQIE